MAIGLMKAATGPVFVFFIERFDCVTGLAAWSPFCRPDDGFPFFLCFASERDFAGISEPCSIAIRR